MTDWVKFCRDEAQGTFYAPLKEKWTSVGDHIEKLEAALDDAMQYVARADWHYLKNETRELLEGEDG